MSVYLIETWNKSYKKTTTAKNAYGNKDFRGFRAALAASILGGSLIGLKSATPY